MNENGSSDEIPFSLNSDVDSQSQSSLVDSLEGEVIGQDGIKIDTRRHQPSRLPRLQRSSRTLSSSSVSGSFLGSQLDEDVPDRFSKKSDANKFKKQNSDSFICFPEGDCGSSHSLCRWNCDGKAIVRENMTSKRRFELQHSRHDMEPEITEYLTPSQRKDQLIKELRTHVRELKQVLNRREMEDEQLREDLKKDAESEEEKRNKELEDVRRELEDMKNKYEDLTKSYEESVKAVTDMEATMSELKMAMENKEKEQDKLYLQMYKKGRQVAQIEREEELQDMVSKGIRSPSFTIRELVRKLAVTETELAKWQSLRRKESYDEGDKPETEAEATLRFLKDSFLHYLTDAKDSDDHLRAMIRIFGFDDEEKKKIAKALLEGKHLKK